MDAVNIIFNKNSNQTGDITNITEDRYYEYDGGSTATLLDVDVTPSPIVKLSPNGGEFTDNLTVTATVSNATSAWYKIGNGSQVNISGNSATFTIGDNMSVGETVTVSWSASNANETKTGSATYKKVEAAVQPEGITVYYDNSTTNWSSVKIHHWSVNETTWPGVDMQAVSSTVYVYTVPEGTSGIVFNNGNGDQTNDINNPQNNHIYKGLGNRNWEDGGLYQSGVEAINFNEDEEPAIYYNIQGMRVTNPTPGFYIVRRGNKVEKVYVY
jgi:hypothetical protein